MKKYEQQNYNSYIDTFPYARAAWEIRNKITEIC